MNFLQAYAHPMAPPLPAEASPAIEWPLPEDCGGIAHASGKGHSIRFLSESREKLAPRCPKRRASNNRKERKRTVSLNLGFHALRQALPHLPLDTKLSKIKTLRLAAEYIKHLESVLEEQEMSNQVDLKMEVPQKKQITQKTSGRTGWPQDVWVLELKQNPS